MIKSFEENPFSNSTYESVWLKHFYNNKEILILDAIEGVKFINHKYFLEPQNFLSYSYLSCVDGSISDTLHSF